MESGCYMWLHMNNLILFTSVERKKFKWECKACISKKMCISGLAVRQTVNADSF